MNSISLADAGIKFKDFLKDKGNSTATIVAYTKDIEQLTEFLAERGITTVDEVKKEDIEAFLARLSKENYTPKSVSRKINSIRTFYRFLKSNNFIKDDPSLLISHPKYELAPPRILTPTEYRALRDAARNDPRMSAIIELLLQTGIRIGELTALRLSDVRGDILHVPSIEKHEERTVPLNKRAQEALNKYLEVRPKTRSVDDFLFITKSGKPFLIRNIRTSIERYYRLAEIKDAKVNDLRHTFVAHHLKNGTSLVLLSKMLGHKRISTTERYLEYVPQRAPENQTLSEL
ncbi:MAG: hypothetical protein A3A51_00610 [Candidatus Levybacteria bacterium RIFCSPLOWO2_01_FULL_39_10]|nr:MAG: hypothetical protein A3A51_00610 [Candidatus Levybacteria bacterium RIFCSPLOWO2_01_FULL_39_10]